MIQKKDCLEMQEQFRELERGMHRGNKKYEDLRERLIEVGKSDTEITKTMYWHWLVGKDGFPESYFYATPPIGEAPESDRILFTGTKAETRDMCEILRGMEVYQRVLTEIQGRRKKLSKGDISIVQVSPEQSDNQLVVATKSLEQHGVQPEYVFSGRVASFWKQFFGEEDFLDKKDRISVPRAIIGTGYMRNYNMYGGETLNVRGRLEKIASGWDIPIQLIDSWAL